MMRYLTWFVFLTAILNLGVSSVEGAEVVPHGKVFTDWKLDLRSSESLGDAPRVAFELKRVYLGAKGNLSERAAFKITYDVGYSGKNYQAFAKVAELVWKKPIANTDLHFGLIGTTTFNLTEKAWGHRGIQKSGPDLWEVRSSADLGLSAVTKLSEAFQLQAAIVNGEGYKKKEEDGYPLVQVRPIFHQASVTISPYVDVMPFKQDDTRKVRVMAGGFVGYSQSPLAVGADFLFQTRGDVKTLLAWGFARYAFSEGWEVILRGDHYDPDTSKSKDDSQLLLVGVSHRPIKQVECALDFQLEHTADDNQGQLFFHSTYSF